MGKRVNPAEWHLVNYRYIDHTWTKENFKKNLDHILTDPYNIDRAYAILSIEYATPAEITACIEYARELGWEAHPDARFKNLEFIYPDAPAQIYYCVVDKTRAEEILTNDLLLQTRPDFDKNKHTCLFTRILYTGLYEQIPASYRPGMIILKLELPKYFRCYMLPLDKSTPALQCFRDIPAEYITRLERNSMDENNENKTLRVHTPLGDLIAYASTDPLNPGIFIDLARDGYDFQLNMTGIECQIDPIGSDRPRLVSHVWTDGLDENPTADLTHTRMDEYFAGDDTNPDHTDE